MAVQLTDVNVGDGGFCVLKGSHKSNFKVPQSIVHGSEAFRTHLYQPVTEAGDVVLFSEATTHGTLPWTSSSQRRAVLFRFCPSNIAYSRSYSPSWSDALVDGTSDAQRAVLEHPYNNRLDRPFLTAGADAGGESPVVNFKVATQSRSDAKKKFDKAVFKNEYF